MGPDREWQSLLLEDLAASTRNALVGGPFGSDLVSTDYIPAGIPVIRGENLSIGRWVGGEFVFVSQKKAQQLAANTAGPLDIVFTQRGANHYRQVAIVPPDADRRLIISQSQMKLTVDPKTADPLYVYYLFCSPVQQEYLQRNAIQTGVPHTNLSILRKVPLRIPPLPMQRSIAHILGTLDDKIELNRRMNETLEVMTQALFKSWFVDFDPVRAKSRAECRGTLQRAPTKTEVHLADLFPDSFEDSELGEIPKGWGVVSLGDVCRRVAMGPFGSDIKTDNFVDYGVPVVRGSNLTNGFVEDSFAFVSEQKADELRNANAFRGDIVITHRGTLGQVGLIPEGSLFPRYVVSQSQMVLSVNHDIVTPRYVYDYLVSPTGQHSLLANTSQTGVPAIARPTTSVRAIRLVLPPIAVLSHFDVLVRQLYIRRDCNVTECGTLAALRDTLLPKLISGELRVTEAERVIGRQI